MLMTRWVTADQKKSIRHWAMEFVIVVTGVLLALWVQQWAEQRRELSDMKAAEEAIHDELRSALQAIMWRKAISQCHIERQELLKSMLLKGDDWPGLTQNAIAGRFAGPPTVIPSVFSRPLDSLATAAWTSALATGALAPMDPERFAKLVALYDHLETLRRARDDETAAVADMSALAFPLHLTSELRAQMIESVYRVDRSRFAFGMVSPTEFAASMRELGWDDERVMDRLILEDAAEAKAQGFVFRPCVAKVENPFRAAPAN